MMGIVCDILLVICICAFVPMAYTSVKIIISKFRRNAD